MAATTKSSSAAASNQADMVTTSVWLLVASYVAYRVLWWAYKIRMQAIEEYGPVIHEFDPYFNYRATEVSCCRAVCICTAVCNLVHWFCTMIRDFAKIWQTMNRVVPFQYWAATVLQEIADTSSGNLVTLLVLCVSAACLWC